MRTQCPHCQALFNIKPEYVGKRTTCKNCAQGFIITEAPAPGSTPLPTAPFPNPGAARSQSSGAARPAAAGEQPQAASSDLRNYGYGPPPAKISGSSMYESQGDEDDSDDDDEEEEIVQSPPPPKAFPARVKALITETPRRTLMTAAGLFFGGMILGFGPAWFISQTEVLRLHDEISTLESEKSSNRARQLTQLKRERGRLQEDIMRASVTAQTYPDNSIPKALALAALEEYKITDALVLQQIAAMETGARVTIETKATSPDPGLAAQLEQEMRTLRDSIEEMRAEAEAMPEMPLLVAETGVATELINLAILNRNRLIAKYGLSSPVPSQYQAGALTGAAEAEKTAARDRLREEARRQIESAAALEEELRKEIDRLTAENQALQNTDANLYAAAVTDLEAGRLSSAEEKFQHLVKLFPKSGLTHQAREGMLQAKEYAAAREAAKQTPVDITLSALRHDGGYLKNETYVRISFKNVSSKMIKKVEFKVLTFDEHGYPIPSKRVAVIKDNDLTAVMSENIPPGKSDYGMWELSEKVRQVKVKLQKVEFYEAETWRDEDIEAWVAKESGRYALDRVAAVK